MRQTGKFELVTAPAAEPLSVTAAKAHARTEHSGEDATFTALIASARRYVEQDCGLALIDQTWRAYFNTWDELGLRLRPHPVSAITEIAVWDGSAFEAQTVGDFQLLAGRPAALIPNDDTAPAIPQRARQGIRVTFTAGFGATEADIPDDLRTAMNQLVTHWYEQREPTAVAASLSVVGDIKFTVASLLQHYRSVRLA